MRFHKKIEKKMREKKWEENYIARTLEILRHAHKNKHPFIKFLDKTLIWFALGISILGNFVISISLAPMILMLPSVVVIMIAIVLGLCFGLLIDIFIRDIDYVTHHHYIIASIFLPAIALINIYVVSNILGTLETIDNFRKVFPNFNLLDLKIAIFLYLISFLLPHMVFKIMEYFENVQ
jgi:hypothetical protein